MITCPFCAASNACAADGECWCFSVDIPNQLLSLVPESYLGQACICQACLEQYKMDPEAFAAPQNKKV